MYIPAIGLTLALEGVPGGGISAKAVLSSLIAVSTWALSLLVSVTYPLCDVSLATAAVRAIRRGATVRREPELKLTRPAERRAQEAILEDMMDGNEFLAVARTKKKRRAKPVGEEDKKRIPVGTLSSM